MWVDNLVYIGTTYTVYIVLHLIINNKLYLNTYIGIIWEGVAECAFLCIFLCKTGGSIEKIFENEGVLDCWKKIHDSSWYTSKKLKGGEIMEFVIGS